MTAPKTRPTDAPVSSFIAQLTPETKRNDAALLDTIYQEATAERPQMWGESIIGYGQYSTTYSSGRQVTWMRSGFSPRKANHSLYLMGGYCSASASEKEQPLLGRLGKFRRGKSCLYINKLADVDLDILRQLIAIDWQAMLTIYPAE